MHSDSHHATASLLHGNTSLHMHCWKNLKGTVGEKKNIEIQLNYAIFILTHWKTNDFALS